MKYIIFELFSGVGLCNQLFSFETAIYFANITNRKLILLIRNPLCHSGKASWDYGHLLDFFTGEYLDYLPNGIEVYYGNEPQTFKDIKNNNNITKDFIEHGRFSSTVFVDRHLDTKDNEDDINEFCNSRNKEYLNFEENQHYDYFYITKSNASRCFYNFYTTKPNYDLMYNICKSIKFKDFYYKIVDSVYESLNVNRNQHNIFLHLRFGDLHKKKEFIERYNDSMSENLSHYFEGHVTNMSKPNIYVLCDNKNNVAFFNNMKNYNLKYVDTITKNCIELYLNKNDRLFNDFNRAKDNSVNTAVIEMLLSVKSDDFIGTLSSTFSHYIQFLRYINNKSCNNYSNIENLNKHCCRFIPIKESKYEWIRDNYKGGHPIAWHRFWDLNFKKSKVFITIYGKTDGFGSQLQAIFSLIAYCYYKGYTYVHTPMYRMQHNDDQIAEFHTYMNDFINIEDKFDSINTISNYEKSIVHQMKEPPFVLGSMQPEFFYNDHILKLFREIYFSKEKPPLQYDTTVNNIALHIRRGDVNKDKYPSRFTSNEIYIDLLQKLDLNNSTIHIFSEGKDEDFIDIVNLFPDNIFVLHLNENIQLTFHYLVMADVLVISKSSFCYCAALINSNVKIANLITNWWHKPFKSWQTPSSYNYYKTINI